MEKKNLSKHAVNTLKTLQGKVIKKHDKLTGVISSRYKLRKQKQQYEQDMRDWEAQPVQTRGALPPIPPPGIFPIKQKELEEDHKEENQLKKITRHSVEKIDDSVKVEP